ncbi:hypothetical protein [Janthinobacterium sp. RB2R34]|uniref:hypothetical protein n=1 Tax=Janthinobacterium sp. RB2R34 TaxID=3424193 RepID=UPI003F2596EA
MKNQSVEKLKSQYKVFVIVILTLSYLMLPLIFGNKITISPSVLFIVGILPNLFWFRFVKIDSGVQSVVTFRGFVLRTFASAAAALLMVIIYRVAYNLGS